MNSKSTTRQAALSLWRDRRSDSKRPPLGLNRIHLKHRPCVREKLRQRQNQPVQSASPSVRHQLYVWHPDKNTNNSKQTGIDALSLTYLLSYELTIDNIILTWSRPLCVRQQCCNIYRAELEVLWERVGRIGEGCGGRSGGIRDYQFVSDGRRTIPRCQSTRRGRRCRRDGL